MMRATRPYANQVKTNPYDTFNQNLDHLLSILGKYYPEDQDLSFYQSKLKTVISANYKAPCELFINVMEDNSQPAGQTSLEQYPYIRAVMQKNDQFFLDLKYDQLVKNPKYLALIKKIMDLWTQPDKPDLKKTISKYMQLLLCYGIKATKRQDLVAIVNEYRTTPLEIA